VLLLGMEKVVSRITDHGKRRIEPDGHICTEYSIAGTSRAACSM
jgi:hypothetical protein